MLFVSNEHVLPSHSARVEQRDQESKRLHRFYRFLGLWVCVGPLSVHLAMFFFFLTVAPNPV
jgi:hypothetical protein